MASFYPASLGLDRWLWFERHPRSRVAKVPAALWMRRKTVSNSRGTTSKTGGSRRHGRRKVDIPRNLARNTAVIVSCRVDGRINQIRLTGMALLATTFSKQSSDGMAALCFSRPFWKSHGSIGPCFFGT